MRSFAAFLAFCLAVSLPAPLAAEAPCKDCKPTAPPSAQLPPPLPPPVVTLLVLAPCVSKPDAEIPYEIFVENRAAAAAHFVVVKAALPANAKLVSSDPPATIDGAELRWNLGTLNGAERRRLLMVFKPTGPGDIENCVRVSYEHGVCVKTKIGGDGAGGGAGTPGGPGTRPPDETVPPPTLLKMPRLELTGDVPARQASGSSFTANLTVSNPGEGPARNVTLTATLPPGLTYEASNPPGNLFEANRVIRWQLDTIEPQKLKNIELKLKGVGQGKQLLQVAATADSNLKADREFSIELYGGVGMHMGVRDTADPLLVGEETEYEILVRNTGTIPATRVQLAAAAPAEMRLSRPRGPSDAPAFRDGDPVMNIAPFNLQPGQEVVFRVSGKALRPGLAKMRVNMTADQLPSGPVLREEVTNIVQDLPTGDFVTSAKPRARAADWAEWVTALAGRWRRLAAGG